MKKKYIIISLSVIAVLGSLFTAFATNMFLADIINIQAGFAHATFFTTLPAIGLALSFVLATLYFIRAYKHPNAVKKITKLYSILLVVFNFIGVLGSVLAASITYHNLFSPVPFPGYLFIFMILNLLLGACGVLGLLNLKKIKDDEEKININFKYVLKTIGWTFFILLTFNRFGTLLMMPLYVYVRNLYMTFPFYIWLLTPLFFGVLEVLFILEVVNKKKLFLLSIIGLGANVALFAYIAVVGMNNSAFIASLSQAMPVERMTSKPLEMLIHLLSYLGVGSVLIVQAKKKPKE